MFLEKHRTDISRWLKHLCHEEFDSHIVITMKSYRRSFRLFIRRRYVIVDLAYSQLTYDK